MEDKYKEWDKFIHSLMLCITSAQRKYRFFLLQDLDAKSPYDLLFTHVALLCTKFSKNFLYCEPYPNLFKFICFKFKEPRLQICPHSKTKWLATVTVHNCNKTEREELIKAVANDCNINLDDIQTIYKEYYSK
jgi:hypothetical protein